MLPSGGHLFWGWGESAEPAGEGKAEDTSQLLRMLAAGSRSSVPVPR